MTTPEQSRYRLYRHNGFTGDWQFVTASKSTDALTAIAAQGGIREYRITELREITVTEKLVQ